LAEAGNWPEVNEDEIDALAEGWWRLFQLERSRLITNPQGLPSWPNGRERLDDINAEPLASDDDLSRSGVSSPGRGVATPRPDPNRDRVGPFSATETRGAISRNMDAMGRLMRLPNSPPCGNGYIGEGGSNHAISRISTRSRA
jgi:hypothetical protein